MSDLASTVQVDGSTVAHATESGSIDLSPGSNDIEVEVTAGNGTTTKTYTVTVNRPLTPPSDNADLSSLVPSEGTLNPTFDADTTSYTVDVDSAVSSITFTPTAEDDGATITVDGTPVASGSPSASIDLDEGDNEVPIVVTAEDETTKMTYTVTVTRAATDDTTITITDPEDLDVVSGTILISGTYTGPVTSIALYIDYEYEDDLISFSGGSWSYSFDTTDLFDTYHVIGVEATPYTSDDSEDEVIVETDNVAGSGIDVSGTISMESGGPATISESAPLIIYALDFETDELGPAAIVLSGSFPYSYTLEDFEDGEYGIGAYLDMDGDLEPSDGDYAWEIYESLVIYGSSVDGVDFTLMEYPISFPPIPNGEINVGLYNADDADGQDVYVAIVVPDGYPSEPADVVGNGYFTITDGYGTTFISTDGINPVTYDGGDYEAYYFIDADGSAGGMPDEGELTGWGEIVVIGNVWYFADYDDMTPFEPEP